MEHNKANSSLKEVCNISISCVYDLTTTVFFKDDRDRLLKYLNIF